MKWHMTEFVNGGKPCMDNELLKWIKAAVTVYVREREKETLPLQEYIDIDKMVVLLFLALPQKVCLEELKKGKDILRSIEEYLRAIFVEHKAGNEQYVRLVGYLPAEQNDLKKINHVFVKLLCKTTVSSMQDEHVTDMDEQIIGYLFWGKILMIKNQDKKYQFGEVQAKFCTSLLNTPPKDKRESVKMYLEQCGIHDVADKREIESYYELGLAYLEEERWKRQKRNGNQRLSVLGIV